MARLSILIGAHTRRALRHMKRCLGRSHTESVRVAADLLGRVGDGHVLIVRQDGTRSVYRID